MRSVAFRKRLFEYNNKRSFCLNYAKTPLKFKDIILCKNVL